MKSAFPVAIKVHHMGQSGWGMEREPTTLSVKLRVGYNNVGLHGVRYVNRSGYNNLPYTTKNSVTQDLIRLD